MYSDLTPILQAINGETADGLSNQANKSLKALTGEDAEFNISGGGSGVEVMGKRVSVGLQPNLLCRFAKTGTGSYSIKAVLKDPSTWHASTGGVMLELKDYGTQPSIVDNSGFFADKTIIGFTCAPYIESKTDGTNINERITREVNGVETVIFNAKSGGVNANNNAGCIIAYAINNDLTEIYYTFGNVTWTENQVTINTALDPTLVHENDAIYYCPVTNQGNQLGFSWYKWINTGSDPGIIARVYFAKSYGARQNISGTYWYSPTVIFNNGKRIMVTIPNGASQFKYALGGSIYFDNYVTSFSCGLYGASNTVSANAPVDQIIEFS